MLQDKRFIYADLLICQECDSTKDIYCKINIVTLYKKLLECVFL